MYICRKQPVLQYISISNSGSKPTNKDFHYEGERLFIVCDGVDGAPYGDVASKLACSSFSEFLNKKTPKPIDEECLNQALKYTIQKFKEAESQYPEIKGMSTTLVLIAFNDEDAIISWLGDSRSYHIRDGQVCFMTEDHSLINELKKQGEVSEENLKTIKNFITKSLNANCNHILSIETITKENIDGEDFFMLCTDGALENISNEAIALTFRKNKSIEGIRDDLMKLCEGKTNDNFTIQIIKV